MFLCFHYRLPQTTAVLCLAFLGFSPQPPLKNKLYGEFMALAVPNHFQDVKLCPLTANGTGSSERLTKDYGFTV